MNNQGTTGLNTRAQGAEVTASGVRYRTWTVHPSPEIVLFDEHGKIRRTLSLEDEGNGYFSTIDAEGKAGDLYQYRLNGNLFPDPASCWQPRGVHGPSQVCSSQNYVWHKPNFTRPRMRDLIIYELHVGTFTREGTFAAAIGKLPQLVDLGVTAIELMPVADFPGKRNWGYDGVFLYAPARAYGTPNELRTLVEAAHGQGLAVILDVVYNHLGPEGNYMGAFNPRYFDHRRKTPWGDSFNYSEPAVRTFFRENAPYWMKEFRIDGFRLDATHTVGDDAERHILSEIAGLIHGGGGIAIAEDERNDCRLCTTVDGGGLGFDGCWADDFHHVVRVAGVGQREGHYANFKGTTGELADTLQHGWLYRGQRQLATNQPRGTECDSMKPAQFIYCISNHDQIGNNAFGERVGQRVDPAFYRAASALLLLAPYTPMIFMGQEWNASTPFLFFTDHSEELGKRVTEGRRREFRDFAAFADAGARERIPDPQGEQTFLASKLNWQERSEGTHALTVALYRELLRIRRTHPVLEDRSRKHWKVEKWPNDIVLIQYERENIGRVAVFVSLTKALSPASIGEIKPEWKSSGDWSLLLSTNDGKYGEPGKAATLVFEQRKTEAILRRS